MGQESLNVCRRTEAHLPHGCCQGTEKLSDGRCVNAVDIAELHWKVSLEGHRYFGAVYNSGANVVMAKASFDKALEDWFTKKCWERLNNG